MNHTAIIALVEKGKKEYEQGNYLASADLFSQAAQAYTSEQDELNAAEMKNNQSVALLQAGKEEEALQATEGTEDIFQNAGDIKRQGIAATFLWPRQEKIFLSYMRRLYIPPGFNCGSADFGAQVGNRLRFIDRQLSCFLCR